jgi:hypothetical protein
MGVKKTLELPGNGSLRAQMRAVQTDRFEIDRYGAPEVLNRRDLIISTPDRVSA